MKIYEVIGWDSGNPVTFYEPTKRAALVCKRRMQAEAEYEDISINPVLVEATRKGIAEAMQWVIDRLCANEH